MSNNILLCGGGGHCKSVLDSLLKSGQYGDIGIIDIKKKIGKDVLGFKIIGCDDDLAKLHENGYQYAFITVGSIGDPSPRIRLSKMIEKIGFKIPNIIDPTAAVSANAVMDVGIFVGKNAVINAGAVIGRYAIINTASIVEHDCKIGNFTHIAPGSVLCGEVSIGNNTHIGAGSIIKQQIKIGSDTIIGMGSIVLHDINDHVLAYGDPCEEVKSL